MLVIGTGKRPESDGGGMNQKYRRRILAAALALPLATAPTALAQSLTPNPVMVSDFAPVTLDGTAKTTTATMSDFSVTDDGGAGWHVTVQATPFQEFDAGTGQYVTGGKTLPAGSLTMPAPTVTPAAASITVAAGPHAIDGASVQLASAAAGTTGTYTFTQGGPLTLTLPSSAYARTYRSEVTIAVASGP
jgi:hypothetical protein